MVIPMSETKSPLARLVLFMVCLSIAGAFIAGVHYAAIDLPQQQSVTTPENGNEGLTRCLAACEAKYWRGTPEGVSKNLGCCNDCIDQYFAS
jgi:hypothetical protein